MMATKGRMKEMRAQMGEMSSRTGNMGSDMEAIEEYQQDLREAMLSQEEVDKKQGSDVSRTFPFVFTTIKRVIGVVNKKNKRSG